MKLDMAIAKKLNGSCIVKIEDGKQFVYMPDGQKIPHQILSRVTDEHDAIPVALIKLFVRFE